MTKTYSHLKLLSTFYWVVGAIYGLLGFLGLAQRMLMQSFTDSYSEPLKIYGKIFSMMPLVMTVIFWLLAIAMFVAANKLRNHTSYGYCFAVAAILCLFMPMGTILGVFTIVVLTRPEAKSIFGKVQSQLDLGSRKGGTYHHAGQSKTLVIIDPDGTIHPGLGLIMAAPTGIVYEVQCDGERHSHDSLEGYYLPVGGVQFNSELGDVDVQDFRRLFHKGDLFRNLSANRKEETGDHYQALKSLVESVPYWQINDGGRFHLNIDESRLDELCEAWVPVLTPDGPGVLTWDNFD